MASESAATRLTSAPCEAPKHFPPLLKGKVDTLQFNIGRLCNQACQHCHVDSSPKRSGPEDNASGEVIDQVLELLQREPALLTLDITGGAPELNPHFRRLVAGARALGRRVLVRHNLTVQFQPGQEDLPEFFLEQGVVLFCSLPCYLEDNVDAQRGNGVFQHSIEALQLLNQIGFGVQPERELNLVYNPRGASLPPPQGPLESDYRRELKVRHGIRFSALLTLANQPIHRFRKELKRRGKLQEYAQLLRDNYNSATLGGVMCRSAVSLRWDGDVFDCDFNLVQGFPQQDGHGRALTITDLLEGTGWLMGNPITVGSHCFACTAGSGSSCGGALVV